MEAEDKGVHVETRQLLGHRNTKVGVNICTYYILNCQYNY